MMAIDSQGNLYAGETVGGRRIQKFVRQGNVKAKDLELVSPAGDPTHPQRHYDPVDRELTSPSTAGRRAAPGHRSIRILEEPRSLHGNAAVGRARGACSWARA